MGECKDLETLQDIGNDKGAETQQVRLQQKNQVIFMTGIGTTHSLQSRRRILGKSQMKIFGILKTMTRQGLVVVGR
jgi:hypothetical protein